MVGAGTPFYFSIFLLFYSFFFIISGIFFGQIIFYFILFYFRIWIYFNELFGNKKDFHWGDIFLLNIYKKFRTVRYLAQSRSAHHSIPQNAHHTGKESGSTTMCMTNIS